MKSTLKRNIKALQNALIYTKEAIARLLGVTVKSITRTMVWWSGFWILIKGRSPRLYKKSLFDKHFANFRKQAATAYTVIKTSANRYLVTPASPPADNSATTEGGTEGGTEGDTETSCYNVWDRGRDNQVKYSCGCRDFVALSQAFKAPACKHIYAVLATQGFGTLKEALDANKALDTAALEAKLAIGL